MLKSDRQTDVEMVTLYELYKLTISLITKDGHIRPATVTKVSLLVHFNVIITLVSKGAKKRPDMDPLSN